LIEEINEFYFIIELTLYIILIIIYHTLQSTLSKFKDVCQLKVIQSLNIT